MITDRVVRGLCCSPAWSPSCHSPASWPMSRAVVSAPSIGVFSPSCRRRSAKPAAASATPSSARRAWCSSPESFGIPLGILAGIYLSEFGGKRLAPALRFCLDVMSGIPSITIGIFCYTLIVVPMKHFSAFAGGVALGLIMLPTVTRTTEELIKLVPDNLREGALAGASHAGAPFFGWSCVASAGICHRRDARCRACRGETAPLFFTAFGNQYWSDVFERADQRRYLCRFSPTPFRPMTSGTRRPGRPRFCLSLWCSC